jgi:O-antigen ligase
MPVGSARLGRPGTLMVRGALRSNPSLLPMGAGVAVLLWMAADEAGFEPSNWYPAGLILLALLVVSLVALPRPAPPRAILLAIGLLVAYAAWSYLSITWADQKDVAWDGANRTLVYAVALALFSLWPVRAEAGAALLGAASLGVAAIGLIALLRANAAGDLRHFFFEGRLISPAGYVNANVALWFVAFWPCAVFAARREVSWPVRGLFVGAATLFASLALLGQSRGWLLALPALTLLALVVVPGRARLLAVLVLVGVATFAISGPLLHVYDASADMGTLDDAVSDATRAVLIAVALATVAGAALAWLDGRRGRARSFLATRRADLAAAGLVATVLLVGLVAFTVKVGNPVTEATDYWDEFKQGGTTPTAGEARLTGTAATDRYDFWRVGMEMFADRPVTGFGADNFQQEYFLRGKSEQQPRYPHSLEVRVLAQTGLVGALLLAGALVAAAVAAAASLRRSRDLAAAVAAAGLLSAAYWLVHGSLDWFWEFAGLGAFAFAALGLAAAVRPAAEANAPVADADSAAAEANAPVAEANAPVAAPRAPRVRGRLAAGAGIVLALVAALSLAAPWLADRYVHQAGAGWRSDPEGAFRWLDRARSLNPLSPTPDVTAGTIAVGLGRLDEAERHFRAALERQDTSGYANLELGAIASEQGRRAEALRRLERAVVLNPRYDVSRTTLRTVRRGGHVTAAAVNRQIVRATRARIGLE